MTRLRMIALGTALLLLPACATNSSLRQARAADELHDYDVAVAQYMKALRERPGDRDAQIGLQTARLRAAEAHFLRGRRYYAQGRYDDALIELQLASELNPSSGDVERDLRTVRAAVRTKMAAPPEGRTALEALVANTRNLPPVGFDLPDVTLPDSFQTGRTATSRDVYLALAKLANLSVLFDPAFREAPAPVSFLANSTVRQALDNVAQNTNTFYRVTAPRTITVIPNTAAKQREYADEVGQTFFLQNADSKQVADMLRSVGDIRALQTIDGVNAIVIRDTPERVQAAGRLINTIDKAPPELVVDVEILEVNRTRLKEYGLQLATPGSAGLDGSIGMTNDQPTLDSLRNLALADLSFGGMPALFYRLLKTDSNTRTLANPHMRMLDGVTAVSNFGDTVPVPVQVIQPIATGGVPTQPITTYQPKDVGVNITIKPRTHMNDEVTLTLTIELTTVAGTGFGGVPTFGKRSVNTQIRLKDGETNILAGLIRSDERYVKDGIPGLSDLRGISHLFTKNRREAQETDVVIMMTPHIVRTLNLAEEDLRPFRIQRVGTASLIESSPVPPPVPIREPASVEIQYPDLPPLLPAGAGAVVPSVPTGKPVTPVPAPPPLKIIK